MTTHVFVVDHKTFKIHLEYLFAGTGAMKYDLVDLNNNSGSILHSTPEKMLVGMMADASRIRKGDNILFYVQQGETQGKFYGIFKAVNNWSFLDHNHLTNQIYLQDKLTKILTFRTLIEPYKVYAEGVTEWEALDEIKNIKAPSQMIWSLIYRKLKGKRGNTMITYYESERLCQLIRDKNNKQEIIHQNTMLSFDERMEIIIDTGKPPNNYDGHQEEINILPRLNHKSHKGQRFEVHLQAYIIKNLGLGINQSLDDSVLQDKNMEWLGNEVSCGVGMQRIDIMLAVKDGEQPICVPIELKAALADAHNIIQIQRYVDWIEQYYLPNKPSDIQPILITKEYPNKDSNDYKQIIDSFIQFNQDNKNINKLRYIEYALKDNDLLFKSVEY